MGTTGENLSRACGASESKLGVLWNGVGGLTDPGGTSGVGDLVRSITVTGCFIGGNAFAGRGLVDSPAISLIIAIASTL